MSIRIKNCGLSTAETVQAAHESGAEFLGFVHYTDSPRHVDAITAHNLTLDLPSQVKTVAVLVDPSDTLLDALLKNWRPHYLQLHGDESIERLETIRTRYGLPIIKAVGIAHADDISHALTYQHHADMLLLDTKHEAMRGGSGQSFDWSLLDGIQLSVPWFLSGGLDASNVVEALTRTRAPMVDISSGIESSRGIKDVAKIIHFNQQVRQYA